MDDRDIIRILSRIEIIDQRIEKMSDTVEQVIVNLIEQDDIPVGFVRLILDIFQT